MAIYYAALLVLRANDCHFLGEGEIGGAQHSSVAFAFAFAVDVVEAKTRLSHGLF